MSGGIDGPPVPPKRQSSTKGKHIIQNNPLPKGQSCLSCRTRKVRCDGRVPACAACLRTARFERRDLSEIRCQYVQRKSPSFSPPPDSSSTSTHVYRDGRLPRASPDRQALKASTRMRQKPVPEEDELAPSVKDRRTKGKDPRGDGKDPQSSQRGLGKSPYRRAEPLPPRLSIPCSRPSVLERPGEPPDFFQYSLPVYSVPTSHCHPSSSTYDVSPTSPASTTAVSWQITTAPASLYPSPHPASAELPAPDLTAFGGYAFPLRPASSDSARPVQFAPYVDASTYHAPQRHHAEQSTSAPVSSAASPARSSYRSLSRLSSVSQPSVFQLPSPTSTTGTSAERHPPLSLGVASIPLPPQYHSPNDSTFSSLFLPSAPCAPTSALPAPRPFAYSMPPFCQGGFFPDPFDPGQTTWSALDLVASEMLANEPSDSFDFLKPPPPPPPTTAAAAAAAATSAPSSTTRQYTG